MNPTLTTYGLTHDPFANDLPPAAYAMSPHVEHFVGRVERLARDGGFAAVIGEPGTGKSTVQRQLEARLARRADLRVGELTRPQCSVADLYRELGELFNVMLSPHNRWAGTQDLRERWQRHIESALYRPVLLIDEAQEMKPPVLTELRLLASSRLDSRLLLAVVLSGDGRLIDKLGTRDLAPLRSRLRVRMTLESLSPSELRPRLDHLLTAAGNPALMTEGLKETLCERAGGNLRTLAQLGTDLLEAGMQRGGVQLDEQLFLAMATDAAPMAVAHSAPSTAKAGARGASSRAR